MTITIVDVMNEYGIAPERDLTVPVGTLVRERWKTEHGGALPPKELRKKTNGKGGSHCLAVYPENWKRNILEAIQIVTRRDVEAIV
jgi:hypothetical protein